jgi:hypothetical protein
MEKIEIYSSKKKAFLLLLASLAFVSAGTYMFMNAENFTSRSPLQIKGIGIISVLFFGLGIYVSIKQLIKNQLVLIIDSIGINVNPKKTEVIQWENIKGFSETKIQNTSIVIIDVSNPNYWIEKESNGIRKKLMQFNVNSYGSPFNLSVNSMQISYDELMKTLNENLEKYKKNA